MHIDSTRCHTCSAAGWDVCWQHACRHLGKVVPGDVVLRHHPRRKAAGGIQLQNMKRASMSYNCSCADVHGSRGAPAGTGTHGAKQSPLHAYGRHQLRPQVSWRARGHADLLVGLGIPQVPIAPRQRGAHVGARHRRLPAAHHAVNYGGFLMYSIKWTRCVLRHTLDVSY